MEEENQIQQPPDDVPDEDFTLAIESDFTTEEDLVIKQEPQEIIPELMSPEVMDENALFHEAGLDDQIDEDLAEHYPDVTDDIMQRAVSPPNVDDIDDQRIEELSLYYRDIYNLKDPSLKLEKCDKLWKTFEIIKDIQSILPVEESIPKSPVKNRPKLPDSPVPPPQKIFETGIVIKNHPDYRFSVKNHKKIYHCLTCQLVFTKKEQFHQHAISVHEIYTHPKRMYQMRENQVKKAPVMPHIHKNHFAERPSVMNVIPGDQPIENIQPIHPPDIETVKIAQHSLNRNKKSEEYKIKKKSQQKKRRIRCTLCKRVTVDIRSHLKIFHKVACISSIIDKCEVVSEGDDSENTVNSSNISGAENSMEDDNLPTNTKETGELQSVENNQQINMNTVLPGKRMKKKRRYLTHFTMQKKRRTDLTSNVVTDTNRANVIKSSFKCHICLGVYKTIKTFRYHKKLHMLRKETAENFDPSKCRFKNSPLKVSKSSVSIATVTKSCLQKKENPKLQASITNYITVEDKPIQSIQGTNESIVTSDQNHVDHSNHTEQTTCVECGRTFRDYHTTYLHKRKCKGIKDSDSGIGISIKIKKNKDSYEVVPSNISPEENYKEPSSSKDSDVSSNDSGMVSVSSNSNNTKLDMPESSNIIKKGHSILKIQAVEDDEDVDIDIEAEDPNVNTTQVNLNPSSSENNSQNADDSIQTDNRTGRHSSRRSNAAPSCNVSKQEIEKTTELESKMTTYKCQTCCTFFNNKTELMNHGVEMNHVVKNHCPCGKEFKNLKFLNNHVRRYHPTLTNCNYCMTKLDRIEKYSEHQCKITEGKLFIEPILQTECLQCKTLVDIGELFDKHMKTHSTDATIFYQCFKCNLRFNNVDMRKAHFSKEHGYALCRICSKLLHLDYLSKHEAYHDGLGHPCHLCKKTFTQKNLLKKHVQNTHEPLVNEVVKCVVCSKVMKLKYLKKHMSEHLHTEICKKCNKCYRIDGQKNLELHIAVEHPHNYPVLKCDICNATFITDKEFKEHSQKGSCKSNGVNAPADLSNVKCEPVTD